jgi:uncharacterized membrane protein YdjX (TVP38/TMEM64 family)
MELKTKPLAKFIIFVILMVAFFAAGNFFSINSEAIDDFLSQFSFTYAAIIFIALYIVGTFVIWYLKDPLKIIGAVIFGAYFSTLFIYIAEIINATLFFCLSRSLGRDFVAKKSKGKFRKLYQNLGGINTGWIFLLRAVPLIPYRVLDLTFGLSRVSFSRYMIVVILASLPRIFWIQFICASVREFTISGIMQYFSQNIEVYIISFLYFCIALVVAFKLKKKFQ